ncbi:hypothetical protein PAMP_015641 [Pampus punctatissimus]
MPPKPIKHKNTQHGSNNQATLMRRHFGSQKAQNWASVVTEYQERFLPPHCHKSIITTSTQTDPYHPLKGTGADQTTFRSYFIAQKWMKNPEKIQIPQPLVPPKCQRTCNGALYNHNPSKEDYTSVYKNDFQAWKSNKRQPHKVRDYLKVNQGLVVTQSASKNDRRQNSPQVQEPVPFESITSYRSDYITHPVQARIRRVKPIFQTSTDLPLQPAASFRQHPFDDTTEKPQHPAENRTSSFKCITTGTDGSRLYWATCLDRGASWSTEGLHEELLHDI